MKKKIALITGVTGQDGAYLSKFLLNKNYVVHGLKRRSSLINTIRIDDIFNHKNFHLHHGDMTDSLSIQRVLEKTKPDEIYNLAAQSHVAVSFDQPEYTSNTAGLGTLRLLESIRILKMKSVKFYQAGTSEMFGNSYSKKQNEKTPLIPRSPYAAAKIYAHWITVNYREAYNLFASNGILFNHESPLRGETFVTRKIIRGLVNIKRKKINELVLGNLYSKRDWGHARDYVEAMWKILQHKEPDDFVISTGKQISVKEFINLSCKELGIKIFWKGNGINTLGLDQKNRVIIRCSKKYYRPTEVDSLLGDSTKARKKLKWKPKTNIKNLIREMIANEEK
jgi:GDPmannose 4,6-dehydratase|tara:strand:+ start:320 stop:1330 length:1011 start_codon:yes stop_codon:yes gene_type:complete